MRSIPKARQIRPGATLVELLLFAGLLAIVSIAVLPLFFSVSRNRLYQQSASVVEQNGAQLLQTLARKIRSAERILDPPTGQTGAVLALQTGSGALDPTIFTLSSGALIMIEKTTKRTLSSPQVGIIDFVVRNTSTAANRPSTHLSFRITRTIRLQAPHTYTRDFVTLVTLFPDDVLEGNTCGCPAPSCGNGGGSYGWGICQSGQCSSVSTVLDCP